MRTFGIRGARPGLGIKRVSKLDAAKSRRKSLIFIREQKKGPCTDCGVTYPTGVMDFDHVPGRGGKMFTLAKPPVGISFRAIQAEFEKCDLVCANCHRLRHLKRRTENAASRRRRIKELEALIQRTNDPDERRQYKGAARRLRKKPQEQFLPSKSEERAARAAGALYARRGLATDMRPRLRDVSLENEREG